MSVWRGRRVFLTGHTGFKGSWLALWLADRGADITGYALPPITDPNLFDAARVAEMVTHVEGDIRDMPALERAVQRARPEVVFHLAAQPLVRESYVTPVETYATNVMGTVHLLDALRRVDGVKATICITSDKAYENREWVWPYRESDPMGGHDPYSSSKGAAEIAIAAWRRSFFQGGMALGSVRAGNVIGGGDWSADRLIPDILQAIQKRGQSGGQSEGQSGEKPLIRNPSSVRPWQHVLDALGGYILLAEKMLAGAPGMDTAWNFGPGEDDARPVAWIVERLLALWGGTQGWTLAKGPQPHEAGLLKLDCAKARAGLGWRPVLALDDALGYIVDWHKAVAGGEDARAVTIRQIRIFQALSQSQGQRARDKS